MNVREIVNLLHKSVKEGTYDLLPTKKNRDSRRKFGLTILDIELFLESIEITDLYSGPEPDRDVPGEELFKFKKEILEGTYFYIKIKKDSTVDFERIKILSCHEDEV